MGAFRVIARLDIKTGHLVKGYQMEGIRKLGDPAPFAERYANDGADELLFCDVVASLYGRCSMLDVIDKVTHKVFVPITVVGGLRSVEDMRMAMRVGADKVGINTAAIARPELISEAAVAFGKQAVVVSIEAKRKGDGTYECYTEGGREPSGKEVGAWAKEAEERGAGEILVTSIDRDGTVQGIDYSLCDGVGGIQIPVLAAGGYCAGDVSKSSRNEGLDGIVIGTALHSGAVTITQIKRALMNVGFSVRPPVAVAA